MYINLNAEHAVSIVDLMNKLNVKAREPKLHREFRAVPSPYRILPAQKTLWSVAAEDDDLGVERSTKAPPIKFLRKQSHNHQ